MAQFRHFVFAKGRGPGLDPCVQFILVFQPAGHRTEFGRDGATYDLRQPLEFLVRMANNYLPGDVWAADLLIGIVFLAVGVIVWRMRHTKKP